MFRSHLIEAGYGETILTIKTCIINNNNNNDLMVVETSSGHTLRRERNIAEWTM